MSKVYIDAFWCHKESITGSTPAEKINPTNTNTTFSARSRRIAPSCLLTLRFSPSARLPGSERLFGASQECFCVRCAREASLREIAGATALAAKLFQRLAEQISHVGRAALRLRQYHVPARPARKQRHRIRLRDNLRRQQRKICRRSLVNRRRNNVRSPRPARRARCIRRTLR